MQTLSLAHLIDGGFELLIGERERTRCHGHHCEATANDPKNRSHEVVPSSIRLPDNDLNRCKIVGEFRLWDCLSLDGPDVVLVGELVAPHTIAFESRVHDLDVVVRCHVELWHGESLAIDGIHALPVL